MFFAFRCAKTGLMYPDDYIDKWGVKYGFGLGPTPISEALHNQYQLPICGDMHPVGVCMSQVDCVRVDMKEFEDNKAIISTEDPILRVRGKLMRDKQLVKSVLMKQRFPDEVEMAIERLKQPVETYLEL